MSCARSPKKNCRVPTTVSRHRRMPNRRCSDNSRASTAFPPAPNRSRTATATLVSSSIETEQPLRMRDEDMTMTNGTSFDRRRTLRRLGALAGLSVLLGACTNTTGEVVTASVPDDYRLRHPIAVEEANHSIVIFVGSGRGGLSASQRADVMGLARTWVREGTGAIVADVPVDTANARAAASAFQEIQAVLAAGGVPAHGITLHHYHPDDPQTLPTIRLSYPKISAVAGPCGLWPADIGPSV